MKKIIYSIIFTALTATQSIARDNVQIAGSSTVLPLVFYVKRQHLDVIPGLREYVSFFMSDEIAGPGGPLSEYGLVPDPDIATIQQKIIDM